MNKKKAIFDATLSIAASAIPVVSLQLIILPLLARYLPDGDAYGKVITLVGVTTVLTQTFGPLNNVRLMLNCDYEEQQLSGDFNLLLLLFSGAGALCSVVGAYLYIGSFDIAHIFLITLITALNITSGYFTVAFRLKIDYLKILFSNMVLCLGYAVGFGVFLATSYWEWIYLTGALLQLLYVILNGNLQKEPYTVTPLMKKTLYQSVILMLACLLGSMVTYIDRFLLFPLIGGTALSIYYASTVLGKAIALGITPIAGVMLSYFAGMKQISKKAITTILSLVTAVGLLGYGVCILISPMLLTFLYPQWAHEALELIYITTFTAIVNMICSAISPIILKFRSINWQIAIHLMTLTIYISSSLPLMNSYGLIGFCIGALFSSVVRLAVMIVICYASNTKAKSLG